MYDGTANHGTTLLLLSLLLCWSHRVLHASIFSLFLFLVIHACVFLTSITHFADPTGYDMMMMMNPCWCHKGCAHKVDSTLATQHVHPTQKGKLTTSLNESGSTHTSTLSGTSLAAQMSANWLLIPLPVSVQSLSPSFNVFISSLYPFSHTQLFSCCTHTIRRGYAALFCPKLLFQGCHLLFGCYARIHKKKKE